MGGYEPPSDGAVHYSSTPLWDTIRRHYARLQDSVPEYTRRVDLDTFGSLYVEQVRQRGAQGVAGSLAPGAAQDTGNYGA